MKLQSLAIIFILIVLPIAMVFSAYVDNKIACEELKLQYDTQLLNATYDAVKAYQLNTVNNQFGDITNEKVDDINAAVNTLLNSLTTGFGYSGYSSSVMKDYVPAVVFTTYDGYYIYSPYTNTLTNLTEYDESDPDATIEGSYDSSYSEDGETVTGLKPYVTYSCRYLTQSTGGATSSFDVVISYTLDNYITIEGEINDTYYYDYGYLYDVGTGNYAINKIDDETYTYDGITFSKSDTEEMKEYVGNKEYSFVKINGVKYYLDEDYDDSDVQDGGIEIEVDLDGDGISDRTESISDTCGIFYIDSTGEKNYNQAKYGTTEEAHNRFIKYYKAIKYNQSAYQYYKNAYEFSCAVMGNPVSDYTDKAGTEVDSTNGYSLKELTWGNASIWSKESEETTSLEDYAASGTGTDSKIFSGSDAIQLSTSNFNEHRKAIIRYTVETNLVASIAGFSSSKGSSFIMPKISEDDWDIIENDVCAISFLQGMTIGNRNYNGYAVVANTLTNEYIDENDIYILTQDSTGNYTYCKANDGTIATSGSGVNVLEKERTVGDSGDEDSKFNFYAGVWKLDFEVKQDVSSNDDTTRYYIPLSYPWSSATNHQLSYYGSYTSIYGSFNINTISTEEVSDMYMYMHKKVNNTELKYAYYYGLGRERWGSFNVNNVNFELYGTTRPDGYFLSDYE